MGDFNELRNSAKRKGTTFCQAGAAHFNSFIASAGLSDLPLGERRFTRMNKFSDDALIMGEWSLHNANVLTRIFTCFYLAFRHKVNYIKSKPSGIEVTNLELNSIANSIGFQPSLLLWIYLRLPIGAKMSRCESWSPIVDQFHKCLSMWKAKSLSFGGHLTLIKSVLEAWVYITSPPSRLLLALLTSLKALG
nr:hypothetical protein [Tanacetum cinerariifolium]